MHKRSSRVAKRSAGVSTSIEALEPRAYLNGVELGAPISSSTGGLSPSSIAVTTASGANADFNGDGKTDLVIADVTDKKVGLYLGNGDGTFQTPVTTAVQANADTLAIADMNGDGKLDIVTGGAGYVSIVQGDGAGGLVLGANIATSVQDIRAIAVADLNGDGRNDIVTASAMSSQIIVPFSAGVVTPAVSADPPSVEALIQQPDGSFVQQNISTMTGLSSMAVGDFNGDGRPDLAFTLQDENAVVVMLNNGDGTFGSPSQYAVGLGPVSLVAADFNGDGKLDLAALNSGVTAQAIPVSGSTSGTISFLAGNGDGTFKAAVGSSIGEVGTNISATMVAAPFNSSDALPDLLINLGGNSSSLPQGVVALNNGDGTFHLGTTVVTGGGTSVGMVAGDLNTGDAFTDVLAADPNALTSLLNVTSQDTTPPTASLSPPSIATPAPASPTYQFTVYFSDDKQLDASTVGANSITVTGPDGTVLPVTLVSRDADNGPHLQPTYQFAFAGQYYGTYTVSAATTGSAAVRDANGNALANSAVGTFDVIPPAQTSFTTTVALTGQFPQSAAASAKGSPVKVTVIAGPGQLGFSHSSDCVVTLAASPTSTFTSNSIILGQMDRRVSTASHSMSVAFKKWNYPSVAGNYFIVATTSLTAVSASSTSSVSVQPATVSLQNLWNGATSNIVRHGRIDFSFQVQNTGTATAKGTLLIDLVATFSGDGAIYPMTQNVRVNIAPGQKQTIHLHVAPKAVPSGTYDLALTLNPLTGFAGTGLTSNTVTSTSSISL